jgi:hypothetical protein
VSFNRFRVVDVFDIPGRRDRIAVLEVLEGDVDSVASPLVSAETSGQWRLTAKVHAGPFNNASDVQRNRVPIGIEGPLTLAVGMELFEPSEALV